MAMHAWLAAPAPRHQNISAQQWASAAGAESRHAAKAVHLNKLQMKLKGAGGEEMAWRQPGLRQL